MTVALTPLSVTVPWLGNRAGARHSLALSLSTVRMADWPILSSTCFQLGYKATNHNRHELTTRFPRKKNAPLAPKRRARGCWLFALLE